MLRKVHAVDNCASHDTKRILAVITVGIMAKFFGDRITIFRVVNESSRGVLATGYFQSA